MVGGHVRSSQGVRTVAGSITPGLMRGLSYYTPQSPPPEPPLRGYTKLNRRLVYVRGQDAPKFLNGLITNHLTGPDDHGAFGFYAAFLNSKGRIISDSFIYPTHYSTLMSDTANAVGVGSRSTTGDGSSSSEVPGYLVECDSSLASSLVSMLKLHKLRSRVEISLVEDTGSSPKVWQVWDDSTVTDSLPLDITNQSILVPYCPSLVGASDSRAPGFGLRLVLPGNQTPLDVLSEAFVSADEFPECSPDAYHIRRLVYGIPEGASELPPNSSLPLDSCMDYMGGVDFNKGCYQGQELTIRSHHHGIVRKRIIPVVLSPPLTSDSNPDPATHSLDQSESSSQPSNKSSDELVQQEYELESEPALEYNPSSPVATSINSASLAGSSILDISASLGDSSRLARVTDNPSPFGVSKKSKPSSSSSSSPSLRPSGTLLSAIGNVGLALVRLEHFGSSTAQFAIQTPAGNIRVHGFQPYWWPSPDDNTDSSA
ncbi:Iba57p [Sugiyamaella lignohabitans]|uniref:Iba57p n=1 Tax=Sugiyamaella lignohabitans TaxID=796027 RepID=A0A167CTM6_9ASCO|nr:Iba57p [Sugiyamaella lignohabitans]ANB12092.1 Iba57p [Sugiyamaella lignohabitans]